MFYYAQIDGEYLVINTYNLTEPSTNPNYIAITEEQYANDDLVGKYYNSLRGQFEIIDWDEWVGSSNLFTHFNTEMNCNTEMQLSTKIDNMQAEINSKVGVDHTHDGYVASADLDLLEDIVSTKADASHTHDGYALSNHTHTGYVSQTDFDALSEAIDGKANANHSHSEYASVSHLHEEYASTSHNHNSDYAPLSHSHSDYATTSDLDELSEVVSNKANASHTHDDRYFTETEINSKLATKSDSSHTHTGIYDENGAAANALASANAYTDSKIDALIGEGASTTLDTIGEISSAIEDNQDAIDLLNSAIANKANTSDLTSHTSNKSNPHNVTLTQLGISATASELNIMDGVVATTEEINYLDGVTSNIQTQLNGKAPSSHTHNYAGSSSTGGAATSANKINTDAGSTTQPVYFVNGVPVATTYTLEKSVPSNAVFTDTNTKVTNTLATTTKAYVTGTTSATTNTGTQVFDTGVYLDTTAGKLVASTFSGLTFSGSGVATVSEVESYLGI